MCSVLNTLSEYTYFYISKNITSYTFVACFQNLILLSLSASSIVVPSVFVIHLVNGAQFLNATYVA